MEPISSARCFSHSRGQITTPKRYRNRFGHPAGPIVRRYRELGAEVITTAHGGALRFTTGDGGYRPYRWFYTRYWHNYPCQMTASARAAWWLGRVAWPRECGAAPPAVRRAFL